MATISHTIYSHYSAPKREILAIEHHALDEYVDPWEIESSSFF